MKRRRWIVGQSLGGVLFAHWPVAPERLSLALPPGLTLDTWEDRAFLGVVAFRVLEVRAPGLGRVPAGVAGVQVNVRTYVTAGSDPGVWFFKLFTSSRLIALAGRAGFGLPFAHATTVGADEEAGIRYQLRLPGLPGGPQLDARISPEGRSRVARAGSLDYWLVERYAVFRNGPRGVVASTIDHAPWALEPARGDVRADALLAALGLRAPDCAPTLRFARACDLRVSLPTRRPSG